MNCELSEEVLSAYADGELKRLERRSAEMHLSGCTRCSIRVRTIREIKSSLMRLPQPAMPSGFREALLAEARKVDSLVMTRSLRSENRFEQAKRVVKAWVDTVTGRLTVGAAALGTACLVLLLASSGESPLAGSIPIDVMLSAHTEYARSVSEMAVRERGSVAPTPLGGMGAGDE